MTKSGIGFLSFCGLAIVLACNEVTVDPYGESQYYLVNTSSHRILAKAITSDIWDSISSGQIDISSGDTGYFGMASGMGSPTPSHIFTEIDLKVTDTGDTVNILDTIKPVSTDDWRHIQTSASPQKMKWYFKYQ